MNALPSNLIFQEGGTMALAIFTNDLKPVIVVVDLCTMIRRGLRILGGRIMDVWPHVNDFVVRGCDVIDRLLSRCLRALK